jgi:hypothetical protein
MEYDAGGLLVHSQELTIINLDHPGTIGYAIGSAMLSCSGQSFAQRSLEACRAPIGLQLCLLLDLALSVTTVKLAHLQFSWLSWHY